MAEAQPQESEEELNKGGRPLKFQSAGELGQKLEAYFSDYDPHVAERLIMKTRSDGSTYTATEDYITRRSPTPPKKFDLRVAEKLRLALELGSPCRN